MRIDLPHVDYLTHKEALYALRKKYNIRPERVKGIIRRLFVVNHKRQTKILGVCIIWNNKIKLKKTFKLGDLFIK